MSTQVQFPPGEPLRRYAGASAEERKKQRRERLIEAAFDVFGREGYRNTTMRLICAQARLTERYFYEHFATTDDVFVAVHRRQSAIVSQRIMAEVIQKGSDNQSATRAGLHAFFLFIKEDPLNMQAKVASYADFVRAGIKSSHPTLKLNLDVDLVIAGFVGMIIQTGAMWVQRDCDLPIESVVDHNMYAWSGLQKWLDDHSQPAASI
jgi:AcrR family transcriptional regulator